MVSIVGIDSRSFTRERIKKDGTKGTFESVLGIAVKVRDYVSYYKKYVSAIKIATNKLSKPMDYLCLSYNDIKDDTNSNEFLEEFFKEINDEIESVHVFFSLFSQKRVPRIKVYGRESRKEKIKLNKPTRTHRELLNEHLLNCFPAVCAWRITEHLNHKTIEFHIDSFSEVHTFKAYEDLVDSRYKLRVYTGGDCVNPVISTADLMIELLDYRLENAGKLLLYENIRPALCEMETRVYVYPITNKHLPDITPLESKAINLMHYLKHPIFWIFKGEEIIDSQVLKRSTAYRKLQDYAASHHGIVKMFGKRDIYNFEVGDYGVYLNSRGKEQIESFIKMDKPFKPLKFDFLI